MVEQPEGALHVTGLEGPMTFLKRLPQSVWILAAVISLVSAQAQANTVTYDSASTFAGAVGTSITDNYQNPGYTLSGMTDAQMSAVLGQTTYTTTGFTNNDIVFNFGGTLAYCGGCNGSFTLGFLNTSVSLSGGVFGVGFNFLNGGSPQYDAFVTFADGSTQNYLLPISNDLSAFFGITSDLLIASIAFGLADGGTTQSGTFAITNLTVARPPQPPLSPPLSLSSLVVLECWACSAGADSEGSRRLRRYAAASQKGRMISAPAPS
jgi:hypothetical protein